MPPEEVQAEQAETTTTTSEETTADKGKTFTEADVERIVKDRLKRDGQSKAKVLDEFIKELGFEKPEQVKALVQAKNEADDAKKSEAQKLQEQIVQLQQERDAEKQRATDAESARRAEKINGRIEALAVKAKAHDAGDVVAHLRAKYPTEVDALMADDGTVNEKAADTLMDKAKTDKPHYFGAKGGVGSPSFNDGVPIKPGAEADKVARDSHFRSARRDI